MHLTPQRYILKMMVTILHNVRSIFNVGSIFRTSDGSGIEKLYLCGITPTPVGRFGMKDQRFAKVALGAEHAVPWERVQSATRLIDRLKKAGWFIVALELHSRARTYNTLRIPKRKRERAALVVGDEVRGLPPGVLKRADVIIEIPMRGKKESLNVSVAFGIAAYSLLE